ncbi:MAG: hypothetical protein Q8N83_16225 [Ignavibacteria bacterium]|nr:hypothetical protein [Ignavibacteria bacterium]
MKSAAFIHGRSISVDEISKARQSNKPIFFVPQVHNIETLLEKTSGIFNSCSPRAIFSPCSQGKTTELNYIKYLYRNFPTLNKANPIEIASMRWNGDELRNQLSEKLKSLSKNTLYEIISTSKNIKRNSFSLVMIDAIEKLEKNSLHWLVANIHNLEEEKVGFLRENKILIVISGRVSFEMLTRATNSPLDKITEHTVRDFLLSEIKEYLEIFSKNNPISFSEKFKSKIFNYTNGDKYYTQFLCDKVVTTLNFTRPKHVILKKHLDVALNNYFNSGYLNDTITHNKLKLIAKNEKAFNVLKEISDERDVLWHEIDDDVRKIIYNEAIVYKNENNILFKNYIIKNVFYNAFLRKKKSFVLIEYCLPEIEEAQATIKKKRKRIRNYILENKFTGDLLWFYYGEIIKKIRDKIKIKFINEDLTEFYGMVDKNDLGGREPMIGEGIIIYSTKEKKEIITKTTFL